MAMKMVVQNRYVQMEAACTVAPAPLMANGQPEYYSSSNSSSKFRCKCTAGWEGDRCESDINECSSNNGGCSHNCCNLVGTFKCSCPLGFSLDINQRDCFDIDECLEKNGGCAHQCTNLDGGYEESDSEIDYRMGY